MPGGTSGSGTSSQPSSGKSLETVKQINFCVGPSLQSSSLATVSRSSGGPVATSAVPGHGPGTVGGNATFYQGATGGGATSIPVASLQSLGLMVTRYAPDPASRHHTVILHPRTMNPSGRGASVVVTSTAGSGTALGPGTSVRTVTTVPIGNSSQHPTPIRTAMIQPNSGNQGQGQSHTSSLSSQGSTIQVMNLSVSNPPSGVAGSHQQTTVKQICTQTGKPFITSAVPLESLGLVVTNDSSNRPIRIHGDVNILNMKPSSGGGVSSIQHNMAKITGAPVTVTRSPSMSAPSLMNTGNHGKMINIMSAPGSVSTTSSATSGHQVTRLGIISQMPASSVTTVAGNKSGKPIINLNKPVILNPAPNVLASGLVTSGGTTVHSVVNMGNVTSFATNVGQKQNMIPVNQAVMTLGAATVVTSGGGTQTRHTLISSSKTTTVGSNMQLTVSQQHQHNQHAHQRANPSNASSGLTVQHQQQMVGGSVPIPISSASPSPLRPTILSSPANSPIKQQPQLQQNTPSSPRPSILIRKRVGNDAQSNQVSTHLYKGSIGATTPTKQSHALLLPPNDAKLLNNIRGVLESKGAEEGVFEANCEVNASGGPGTGLLMPPLTPNSETAGATPRKKPRKQLLEPFNLSTSQNIKLLSSSDDSNKGKDDDRDSMDESRESLMGVCKKPRPSLLSTYNMPWKSLQYHFLRYSDVKPKPEKKLTLSELSNEGLQRKNGWKIHHLATQMEDMSDNENEVYERLTKFLESFEVHQDTVAKSAAFIVSGANSGVCGNSSEAPQPGQICLTDKLSDLIRGNLQRSNLFQEQICEAKQLLIKLTNEHRERVGKLTKKCANKRTFITK